jgi:hypothetical protein
MIAFCFHIKKVLEWNTQNIYRRYCFPWEADLKLSHTTVSMAIILGMMSCSRKRDSSNILRIEWADSGYIYFYFRRSLTIGSGNGVGFRPDDQLDSIRPFCYWSFFHPRSGSKFVVSRRQHFDDRDRLLGPIWTRLRDDPRSVVVFHCVSGQVRSTAFNPTEFAHLNTHVHAFACRHLHIA